MEMRKEERQNLVKRLLTKYDLQKQEDIVRLLVEKGIEVTQATISRDVKEMQLVKVPLAGGGYAYKLPKNAKQDDEQRFRKLFRDGYIGMQTMDKFVSVKTKPGSAAALGSMIEKKYGPHLFAVMTNDDHILLITLEETGAQDLTNRLMNHL